MDLISSRNSKKAWANYRFKIPPIRTICLTVVLIILIHLALNYFSANQDQDIGSMDGGDSNSVINLVVTSCGAKRMEEAETMIKSAILFSQHTRLRIFAYTDEDNKDLFDQKLRKLQVAAHKFQPNFEYEIFSATFPAAPKGMGPWIDVFKPCSALRLFLPNLLPDVDAVVYMDADVLTLSNLTDLWNHFHSMPKSAFIGLSLITEPGGIPYEVNTKYAHYGDTGINTGIAIMNLTRMRMHNFDQLIFKIREGHEHLRPAETGDQFLQNALYSVHPEYVSLFPCAWNLRNLHCICPNCACKSALKDGVAAIHGTKGAFTTSDELPFFKNIYNVFKAVHKEPVLCENEGGRANNYRIFRQNYVLKFSF